MSGNSIDLKYSGKYLSYEEIKKVCLALFIKLSYDLFVTDDILSHL